MRGLHSNGFIKVVKKGLTRIEWMTFINTSNLKFNVFFFTSLVFIFVHSLSAG